MGPGFFIFFRKDGPSGDRLNIRPPEWWFSLSDSRADDVPRIKEIRKKVKKLIQRVDEVEKAVEVVSKSKYASKEIKKLVKSYDLPAEVVDPFSDSSNILSILLEWCLVIQFRNICDDEDAILVLLLA